MRIEMTINLEVPDEQRLAERIAKEYGCEIADISEDDVAEFINHNIKARNTCNDLFLIEGAETDGWLVQCCDTSEFINTMK